MLFKLSVHNLKKSIQDYSIYFFTLILGVSIFYIFNAIDAQTAMMEVSSTKSDVINTMNTALSAMSIVISFILGFLVVYASRFLMKKRKKEFGIYLLLGMRKKDISKILLTETVMIGIFSLMVGLLAGIALSQFMSLFVANMFQADMRQFVFVISKSAIGKTMLYFILIYVVVAVMNLVIISRSQLIDLMDAHKKGEKSRFKKPVVCLFVFIAACLMLGYAYYNVTSGIESMVTEAGVLLQIFLGIFSTFLIFWSVSGLAMLFLKKIPGIYHRKLNSFVLGEVGSQMNTTVFAGGIICLLLFATICILSSAFTLKEYKENTVAELAPISASLSKEMEDSYSIRDIYEIQKIDTDGFEEMEEINTYKTDTVTNKSVLGSYAEVLDFGEDWNQEPIEIIRLSDYNRAAEFYGKELLSFDGGEYVIVTNYGNTISFFNEGLKMNDTITVHNHTLKSRYKKCRDGFLMMSYSKMNMGLIVVPDDISFDESEQYKNYQLIRYTEEKEKDKDFKEYMDSGFWDALNPLDKTWADIYVSTQSNIYDDSIGSSGMVIFIGLYLGIVFIISGAAILALKEMSDAVDSREKYEILRKIGTKEKDIHRALFQEMAVFFGFPLLLAVIHSVFGIQVCNYMLDIYESESIFPSLITTASVIVLIYGGYFIVSYLCCRRIIK